MVQWLEHLVLSQTPSGHEFDSQAPTPGSLQCFQLQFQKIQCSLLASTWHRHKHMNKNFNKVNGDTGFRKKHLKFT